MFYCLVRSLLGQSAFFSGHALRAIAVSYRIYTENSLKPCTCSDVTTMSKAQVETVACKVLSK